MNFNYTKIFVEKKSADYKDLKIASSINIESIEEPKELTSKTKDSFLIVGWNYGIEYTPGIAKLAFSGNLLLSVDQKEAKEILTNWKEKKVDPEFNLLLVNLIMKKANIKAIQFEDEFNLPTHFKMPSVKMANKE